MRTMASSFIDRRVLALLTLAVLSLGVPARADIILSVESVTGAPGSSGVFDVLLENTGPSTQNIAGFGFELSTTDTNITFTDVTINTSAPYIFAGDSLFGPDIITSAPGQTVDASDFSASTNGTDVGAGGIFALGSVAYTIDPAVLNGEIATIDFTASPFTSLSDSGGNNVDFTATPGTITVLTTSPVPEPSTALPLAAAMLFAVWLIRRRRRIAL
jgi:hypothetical protein